MLTSKPKKKPLEQYDRKGKERWLPFETGRNRQKSVPISRIAQVQQ